MIYLDNNNYIQEVYIPRQEYTENSNPEYATVNELETAIANEVIRADGKYATKSELSAATGNVINWVEENYMTSADTQEAISAATEDMATETWVNSQGFLTEHQSLSAYSTTEQMNAAILSAKTEVESDIPTKVSELQNDLNFVNSGDVQTQIDNSISGKQDVLVSGVNIKTINNESILGSGNIEIQGGGAEYEAGQNIEIDANNVISVTGISSYTGITSEDVVDALGFTPISGVDLSDYYTKEEVDDEITASTSAFTTSGEVQSQINDSISGLASTQYVDDSVSGLASEQYVQNAVSGKADSSRVEEIEQVTASALTELENTKLDASAMSAYSTTVEVEGMISSATSGFATEQYVDNSVSGLASETYVDNAVSGKMDTSGMTAYATTAFTEQTYLKEHQSLAGLFDSVNYVSSAKTIYFYDKENTEVGTIDTTDFVKDGMVDNVYVSGDTLYIVFNTDAGKETIEIPLTDIFDPSNYYTKDEVDSAITAATAATTGWVSEQGYLTEHQSLSAYSTTEQMNQAISSATSGLASETYVQNSISGLASTQYVDNSVSGKADISSLSAYTTSADVETQITEKGYVTSGEVETQITDKGYITGYTETDPVFQASAASGISAQDILDWDAKLDSSDLEPYYTSAQTESAITEAVSGLASTQYVDDSVSGKADTSSLSAYTTTSDVEGMISGFTTSADVETQITEKGYITGYTETDPIFTGSPAYGITSGDIANWNSKVDASALTQYATNEHLEEVEEVTASALTQLQNSKLDASAMSAYTPSSGFATINGSAITEGGNLVIEGGSGGTEYQAGDNIQIQNDTISVTGITSYTGITSGDVTTALGFTPISQTDFESSDRAVSEALNDINTRVNTVSANSVTSADVETQITEKGYITGYTETDPVFGASAASGITSGDITNWNNKATTTYVDNAVSGKVGSTDVTTIVKMTQAQYDAISGSASPTTLYIITD